MKHMASAVAGWVLCAVLPMALPPQIRAQATAEPPAELELRGMDGAEQSLQALRGRIVVLNFWATWCVPCREEMPMLARLAQDYESRGVTVIGASADAEETQNQVAPFVRQVGISFPIWLGATTTDMERLALGTALPATVVLDRDGRIAWRILGPLAEPDLRARLDWLLADAAGRGPAPPPVLNTFEQHPHEHREGEEEDHQHGGVGLEGASLVPS